jgi:hypothetical protein
MDLYSLSLTQHFLEELYCSYKSGSIESNADQFKNST